MQPIQSQYLTVKQAAGYMNISKEYLYSLVRAKRIRHIKIGAKTLFTVQDIDEFIKSRTVEPKEPQHINYLNYKYGKQDIELAKKSAIRAYKK
ncbi:MAG: helix-turn-helix domain-containing protein [bacterium]